MLWWKIWICSLFIASLLILGILKPIDSSAQDVENIDESAPSDSLIEDPEINPIAIYAEGLSLSYEEAKNRLIIQDEFTDLVAKIAEKDPTFAGSWIEHEPEFRLSISFTTPNGQKKLRKYLQDIAWADLVTAEQSSFSIGEITSIQNHLHKVGSDNDLRFDSGFNQRERAIKLYTTNPDELRLQLESMPSLKKHLDLFVVEYREPVQAASLPSPNYILRGGVRGNIPGGSCTTGFAVRDKITGSAYMATAGHCGDPMSAALGPLPSYLRSIGPVVERKNDRYADLQIHDALSTGWTLTNQIMAGHTALTIVDYEEKLETQGAYVVKRGAITGSSIGLVTNIRARPYFGGLQRASVFVEAERASWWWNPGPMACPGDSGAPVYRTYPHLSWQQVGVTGILAYGPVRSCTIADQTWFGYTPVDALLSMGYEPMID